MASSMLSLAAAGIFLGSALAAPTPAASQCSNYIVNATDNAWQFNHYKFLDFRSQSSSYSGSSDFTSQYRAQSWSNGKFANQASNIAMTSDTINGVETNMLSLYARHTGAQVTAAELDSADDDYYYASVRIGARVTGASGACAGLFFYHDDTQETDIEILTREQGVHADAQSQLQAGPTTAQLHFTNQPHWTATVDLSPSTDNAVQGASWKDVNSYRIDWVPGMTYWWQNGIMSHTANKNMIQTPSSWIMNIWSNGDPTWSGAMAPNTEARLDILWIEMVYNKFAEGQPKQLPTSAYTGSCAVGAGDGTALGQADSALTTASKPQPATPANAPVATVTKYVTEPADGASWTVGRRAPMKYTA
ncbi:MAG: hypothetical protein GOMPHAMPRED_001925 [Gomphillus americanus]|uniref:GH16 domain-containing protein n=1 Tax=Gomphillus americanus TaxID=1940652 RepID=A0A8H3F792_9LECA|nr:MAG: hypothetical protein GOMPHAMPRED_001925 [Gomphillus americanus]